MTSQTTDMQAMLKRLEKLENENRSLKRAGLLGLTAVGALLLMGQAAPKSRMIEAETVTAHEFVLLGRYNGGHPIALFTNASNNKVDEPVLQFFGPEPLAPEGRILRMTMGATPYPELSIYHALGPGKAGNRKLLSLTTLGNEPHLIIRSGRGNLTGLNAGGLMLQFDDGKPVLTLKDASEYTEIKPLPVH